jgi:hypothetical protein
MFVQKVISLEVVIEFIPPRLIVGKATESITSNCVMNFLESHTRTHAFGFGRTLTSQMSLHRPMVESFLLEPLSFEISTRFNWAISESLRIMLE